MSGRGGDDRGRCQQLGQAGRGSRVSYLPSMWEQGYHLPSMCMGSGSIISLLYRSRGTIFLVSGCKVFIFVLYRSRMYYISIMWEQGPVYPCYIQLLEYPIPAAAARHKNRQVPISRKPRVVSEIRWCQNDRKENSEYKKSKSKEVGFISL